MNRVTYYVVVPLFILLSFSFIRAEAPEFVSWDTLQRVPFEAKWVKEANIDMLFPKFTPQLKALNGKLVRINGYIIPFDKTGAKLALSANPYSACYFCGKAGPASVLTVNLKVPSKKFKTDQYRGVIGRLRLNAQDIRDFYYIIDDAEVLGAK